MSWLNSPLTRRVAATLVISAAGLAGITQYEGEVRRVYLDPVAIPTVCVAHTATVTRSDVGRAFTADKCTSLWRGDTAVAQAAERKLVRVPVTQAQYDALVSFTFNVGGRALGSSTLLRKLNAGDCYGAAAEFPRWNKAKGQVLNGLTARRAWERSIFEPDCP